MSDGDNNLIRQQQSAGELTVEQLAGQMEKLRDVMKRVMKEGEDYGSIPGVGGNKRPLLQPGAEKLCLLFRLAPSYSIVQNDLPGGHREFTVTCKLTHIPTGNFCGEATASCSSLEPKYRYRGGSITCPECGKATVIKGKKEYGGGWLCWPKKGGCNAKFPDEQFSESQIEKQENPDIAGEFNTIVQMAQKRSFLRAIRQATASSELFTQEHGDPSTSAYDDDHHGEPPPSDVPPSASPPKPPAAYIPKCQKCGAPMVKKKRKSDGNEFWSCTKWNREGTGCNGTMSIEQAEAERPGNAPTQVSRDFEQLRDNLYNMGVPKGNLAHADAIVAYAVEGTTLQMCAKDAALANKVLDALIGYNAVGDTTEEIYFKALTAAGVEVPAELQAKVDAILAGQ